MLRSSKKVIQNHINVRGNFKTLFPFFWQTNYVVKGLIFDIYMIIVYYLRNVKSNYCR